MPGFSKEMQDALRADAEKLSAMTGEEHTVEFFNVMFKCTYCDATFDDPTTLCGLEKCNFVVAKAEERS